MLATPLAALHTMTEMKSQPNLQTHMFPSVPGTGTHNIHTHEPPGIGLPDKTDTESMLERTNIHVERSGMGSQRGSPLGATTNSNSSQGANPHGIDHILSRPSQITTGHLHFPASLGFTQNSLGMSSNSAHQTSSNSGLRGFNIAAAAFFHHHAANSVSKAPVDLGRTTGGIYWPGFQGLMANPMAWRDRLNTSKYLPVYTYISLYATRNVQCKAPE